MSLEPRLTILKEGGLLSDKNYQQVKDIILHFQNNHGISLTEGNAATFITHLCAALERISRGEDIHKIDPNVFESMKSESVFKQAEAISDELQTLCPGIPNAEHQFLIVHICALLTQVGKQSG